MAFHGFSWLFQHFFVTTQAVVAEVWRGFPFPSWFSKN
jgi:hypothetical protein